VGGGGERDYNYYNYTIASSNGVWEQAKTTTRNSKRTGKRKNIGNRWDKVE
jgi:hypothetical protein